MIGFGSSVFTQAILGAGGFAKGSSLALDFTSGNRRLDPRITFSRTTNATVTGSNGLIQYAPHNLLTFSEQFDNAAWTKNATTITANSIATPDGALTGDTVVAVGTNLNAVFRPYGSLLSPGACTTSIYAKAGTKSVLQFGANAALTGTADARANFDIANGVLGSVDSATLTASITPVGNGWYRCVVSWTRVGTATANGVWSMQDTTVAAREATSTAGDLYLWGAQLELGSTATPYKPTTVKNLLGYTEHFDNAAWTKSNASISATKVDDIYGQPFAQKLVENTANSGHSVYGSNTLTAAAYTLSVFAKKAEKSWVFLSFDTVTPTGAYFDLDTGVLGTVSAGATATITPFGNGWYRCSVTRTATAATWFSDIGVASANGVRSYTGDGTSGIYIFGAQLSDSVSVDPYVYNPVAAPTAAAYYGPRFDYDPVTLAPKGLLIEEQRTNLLTYSEQFDNAAWTKTSVTATANTAVSPDGTTTADSLVENTSGGEHVAFQQTSKAASAITYTHSIYYKAGSGSRNIGVAITDGTSGGLAAIFNTSGSVVLASQTVGTATGWTAVGAAVTAVGNGWFRASFTATTNTATRVDGVVYLVDGTTRSYTGNGTSSLLIWGAQLEAGAFATSYIPTVASQVTRAVDSASMIGNNFARWYNQANGTAFIDYATFASGSITLPVMEFSDGTTSNRMLFQNNPAGNSRVLAFVGGSDVVTTLDATATSQTKVAATYSAGSWAASYNASAALTNSYAGVVPGQTQLIIGYTTAGGNPRLNGTIKRIAYYPRRLANTELTSLTS